MPASTVALQTAFIALLFLFVIWIARSALRDLRRPDEERWAGRSSAPVQEQTGMHSAARDPRLIVERAPGHAPGMEYEVGAGAILGRGEQAEIRLEDPFASGRHARLTRQGGLVVLEDLGSTNGTYLNEERVTGPQPLHQGDRVRIGDSEFTYVTG
ncbi:unannotated protein [freshwater metagenome]|uniref:Unannotated protein n=1 Tax=freshwater metagenome TaxID=449393 RepID=A0A6J7EL64_9ZZZZ|nr:FHA domain-containing protein [Actinomycetota bacterium]